MLLFLYIILVGFPVSVLYDSTRNTFFVISRISTALDHEEPTGIGLVTG